VPHVEWRIHGAGRTLQHASLEPTSVTSFDAREAGVSRYALMPGRDTACAYTRGLGACDRRVDAGYRPYRTRISRKFCRHGGQPCGACTAWLGTIAQAINACRSPPARTPGRQNCRARVLAWWRRPPRATWDGRARAGPEI